MRSRPVIGRPQLFPGGKQISVMVTAEDYRTLSEVVKRERAEQPLYGFGDKLRAYIRKGLDEDAPERRVARIDPQESRVRQLHALARGVKRIALELEQAR